MSFFNIVAATNEDTVVAAYEPSKVRSDSYQSEAELEKEFIRLLCEQGYTYLPLHTEDELIANLRSQLEELNHYQFSDTEWQQFFSDVIANPNEHIPEKTRKIQEDNVQVLHRDDGSSKNITLIDKKNIHNNRLQVINQYEVKQEDGARHDNRYDVTILVNGFPLVHVELKPRGGHPGGVQPDQPLSAGFVLGGLRFVRVCADFRDLQRHKYQVLLQQHPLQCHQGRQTGQDEKGKEQQ